MDQEIEQENHPDVISFNEFRFPNQIDDLDLNRFCQKIQATYNDSPSDYTNYLKFPNRRRLYSNWQDSGIEKAQVCIKKLDHVVVKHFRIC